VRHFWNAPAGCCVSPNAVCSRGSSRAGRAKIHGQGQRYEAPTFAAAARKRQVIIDTSSTSLLR
jgi:hypothetical protein